MEDYYIAHLEMRYYLQALLGATSSYFRAELPMEDDSAMFKGWVMSKGLHVDASKALLLLDSTSDAWWAVIRYMIKYIYIYIYMCVFAVVLQLRKLL